MTDSNDQGPRLAMPPPDNARRHHAYLAGSGFVQRRAGSIVDAMTASDSPEDWFAGFFSACFAAGQAAFGPAQALECLDYVQAQARQSLNTERQTRGSDAPGEAGEAGEADGTDAEGASKGAPHGRPKLRLL